MAAAPAGGGIPGGGAGVSPQREAAHAGADCRLGGRGARGALQERDGADGRELGLLYLIYLNEKPAPGVMVEALEKVLKKHGLPRGKDRAYQIDMRYPLERFRGWRGTWRRRGRSWRR